MRSGILTLTTDFGTDGPYVASMKGVVLGLAPGAVLVDVSHAITPQHILEGAFVLTALVETFPAGTVHLAVVDPGVGTDRRLVAVSIDGHWFVLPDNGLISGVLRDREPEGVWEISNPEIRRQSVSATFHGRDILAPAAAFLLRGGDPDRLGPRRVLADLVRLGDFEAREEPDSFLAEVIFRDAFGNLITNLRSDRMAGLPAEDWVFEAVGHKIRGLSRTYGDQPAGRLIALVGSSGWVEIAVVNGDAGRLLGLGHGGTVRVLGRRPRP